MYIKINFKSQVGVRLNKLGTENQVGQVTPTEKQNCLFILGWGRVMRDSFSHGEERTNGPA